MTSRPQTSNSTPCPYPSCSWHSTPSATPRQTTDQLRLHLQQAHPDQPTTHLSDRFCHQHQLHPCRLCNEPNAIYLTPRHLQAHVNKSHCRQDTNINIVQHTLRHLSASQTQQWLDQLAFLYNLDLTPPPFRRSSFTKLKPQAKRLSLQTMNMVVDWTNQASLPFATTTRTTHHKHNTDSVPFWKLLFLLEALLLAPIQQTPHRTHHNALKHRVAQLKQGDLILLYNTIWHPPPPHLHRHKRTNKHKHQQQPHNTTPTTPTPTSMAFFAQQAADLGNIRAAHNRLTATMPIATLTPERINIVATTLYPPRIDPPHNLRNHQYTPNHHTTIPDSVFEQGLHRLSQGTAPGPFSASIDSLRALGLQRSTTHPASDRPYFHNLKKLFTFLLNNQIPSSIRPYFSSIHFFALHKDMNNLNKLRPIGIGTALRRAAATIALSLTSNDIEPLLTQQGQYGINTSGGVDFTAHLTQQHIDRYITKDNSTPPSRALILLDLTNMFNACSRSRCREILQRNDATKPLLALFDLLYAADTNNWYQDHEGNNHTLNQPEGFSQGCPLSPLFACLVLSALTATVNKTLSTRALERIRQHITADDNLGGVSHTASVMDDTSVCLLHEDLLPFLNEFDSLGKPYGIHLHKTKTKIVHNGPAPPPTCTSSPPTFSPITHATSGPPTSALLSIPPSLTIGFITLPSTSRSLPPILTCHPPSPQQSNSVMVNRSIQSQTTPPRFTITPLATNSLMTPPPPLSSTQTTSSFCLFPSTTWEDWVTSPTLSSLDSHLSILSLPPTLPTGPPPNSDALTAAFPTPMVFWLFKIFALLLPTSSTQHRPTPLPALLRVR